MKYLTGVLLSDIKQLHFYRSSIEWCLDFHLS